MDRAPEILRRPAKPRALRLAALASSLVLAGGYVWQRSRADLSVLPDTNSGVGVSQQREVLTVAESRRLIDIEKFDEKANVPDLTADAWPGVQSAAHHSAFNPPVARPERTRKVMLTSSKSGPVDEAFIPMLTAREIVQQSVKNDVPQRLPEFFPTKWEAWRDQPTSPSAAKTEPKHEIKTRTLLPGSKAPFLGMIKNDDR